MRSLSRAPAATLPVRMPIAISLRSRIAPSSGSTPGSRLPRRAARVRSRRRNSLARTFATCRTILDSVLLEHLAHDRPIAASAKESRPRNARCRTRRETSPRRPPVPLPGCGAGLNRCRTEPRTWWIECTAAPGPDAAGASGGPSRSRRSISATCSPRCVTEGRNQSRGVRADSCTLASPFARPARHYPGGEARGPTQRPVPPRQRGARGVRPAHRAAGDRGFRIRSMQVYLGLGSNLGESAEPSVAGHRRAGGARSDHRAGIAGGGVACPAARLRAFGLEPAVPQPRARMLGPMLARAASTPDRRDPARLRASRDVALVAPPHRHRHPAVGSRAHRDRAADHSPPRPDPRSFVLAPLAALAPRLTIPGQGERTVLDCSRSLDRHIPLWMGIVNVTPDSSPTAAGSSTGAGSSPTWRKWSKPVSTSSTSEASRPDPAPPRWTPPPSGPSRPGAGAAGRALGAKQAAAVAEPRHPPIPRWRRRASTWGWTSSTTSAD